MTDGRLYGPAIKIITIFNKKTSSSKPTETI